MASVPEDQLKEGVAFAIALDHTAQKIGIERSAIIIIGRDANAVYDALMTP
jgi:hypothetical protein